MKRNRANIGAATLRAGAPTLIAFNKPFGVLCQFSAAGDRPTLADHIRLTNLYPAGRLDADSEGLLLLTSDGRLQHRITDPVHKLEKRYWVQVEGSLSDDALNQLELGVAISIEGKEHKTLPCKATLLEQEPKVMPRDPPIRFRQNIPTSWISLTLTEGKNRQVRKMTAKVGFPTLRLIRYRIEGITIDQLLPGDMQEISRDFVYKQLFKNL